MERGHDHALAKVELVRLLALGARIERKRIELCRARLSLQVPEQGAADTSRAATLVGDEVVDIKLPVRVGVLVDAVYRHAPYLVAIDGDAHARAASEYAAHLGFVFARQRGA